MPVELHEQTNKTYSSAQQARNSNLRVKCRFIYVTFMQLDWYIYNIHFSKSSVNKCELNSVSYDYSNTILSKIM